LVALSLVIIIGLLWNRKLSIELKNYGVVTKGKVIELKHGGKAADYFVEYKYYVNGSVYEGSVGCSYFECDDGSRGCEGKEVRVIYSQKNPDVSDVDLGHHNDKKGRRLYY